MSIDINQPVFVLSRKDYASGEVSFEMTTLDNQVVDTKIFLTFKNKKDAELIKTLILLGKKYKLTLALEEG